MKIVRLKLNDECATKRMENERTGTKRLDNVDTNEGKNESDKKGEDIAFKRVMEARKSVSEGKLEEKKKNEAKKERNKKQLEKKAEEMRKGQRSVKDMIKWIERHSKKDDKG